MLTVPPDDLFQEATKAVLTSRYSSRVTSYEALSSVGSLAVAAREATARALMAAAAKKIRVTQVGIDLAP